MSTPHLGAEQLELLGRYNTPTISNAIELFDVRPRHTGYLPHFIRCLLPELGVIVGYAVTCQTTAIPPAAGEMEANLLADYLRYVASEPGPKIAVGEDIDDPPGLGAEFGEVTATIHRKLGCVGHITSGCPRDLFWGGFSNNSPCWKSAEEIGCMYWRSCHGIDECALHRLLADCSPLPGGVMVTQGFLVPSFLVRVQAG